MSVRLATAQQMIAYYNAQDADAYVSLMTDDAAEAMHAFQERRAPEYKGR